MRGREGAALNSPDPVLAVCNDSASRVYGMPYSTCKHCHKRFRSLRAGAPYCSDAHRVAAHRKRHAPVPSPRWLGKEPGLSKTSRSLNADRSPALSNQELGCAC